MFNIFSIGNKSRHCLGYASVILTLLYFINLALSRSIDIPTFHLDGAFQTASSLFRIDSGQAPGRDFLPYLGVGPLLLIYPVFKMSGGALSASVFSAHFLTLVLGWTSLSVLWQLIFCPKMAIFSLAGGALVFILPTLISWQLSFPSIFAFAFEPGNSLRPIRVAAPYLVAIASILLIKHNKKTMQRNVIAGLLIGATMLWSNDFAIPTAGLFSIFYCSYFYFEEKATWKFSAMIFCLTAILSWGVLLSLITVGHPFELIKFNFIDVAKDQWWYYGPPDYVSISARLIS